MNNNRKKYYSIEEAINNCLKFIHKDKVFKNAYDMSEDELITIEAYLQQFFYWIDHPDYIQKVPCHYETNTIIL